MRARTRRSSRSSIAQTEGEFATAEIVIENPGEGLLNPARKQYAWISVTADAVTTAMFFGRVTAFPRDLAGQQVTLEFTAQFPGLGGRARRAVRHAQGRALLGRGVHPGLRADQPRPGARGALLALPLRPPHRRDHALRHHHRHCDHGRQRPPRGQRPGSTSPRRRRRRSRSRRPSSGSSTSSARATACTSRSRSSSAAP
jgi:hypothetical protein